MKRNTRQLLFGVIGLAVFLAVGGFFLRRVYLRQSAPARYAAAAAKLAAAGQEEAAIDQYERALRYASPGALRGRICLAYADLLLAGAAMPSELAVRRVWAAQAALDEAFRLLPPDPHLGQRLLTLSSETARASQQPVAWERLAGVADRVARGCPALAAAAKQLALARFQLLLFQGGAKDTVEQRSWRNDLKLTRKQFPLDAELAFADAWLLLLDAEAMTDPAMSIPAAKKYKEALALIRTVSREPANLPGGLLHEVAVLLDMSAVRAQADLKKEAMALLDQAESAIVGGSAADCADAVRLRLGAALVGTAPREDAAIREALAACERLLRNRLRAQPEDWGAETLLARVLCDQGKAAESLALAEAVTRPHQLRPSPAALRFRSCQIEALFVLARLRLDQAKAAADVPARDAALAAVKGYILALRGAGAGAPAVAFLEGVSACVRQELRKGIALLEAVDATAGRALPEAALSAGLALAELRESGAAATRLDRFLANRNFSASSRLGVRLELAEQRLRNREFAEALTLARAVLGVDPENRRARLLAGEASLRQALLVDRNLRVPAKKAEISGYLDPLVRENDPTALRRYAEFNLFTTDQAASLRFLDRLLEQRPNDPDVLILWCHAKSAAGASDEVWRRVSRLAETLPATAAAAFLRGQLGQTARGSLAQLESGIRLALEPDPFRQEIRLGTFFLSGGELSAARAALTRVAGLREKSPETRLLRFDLALLEKDWDTAETCAEEEGRQQGSAEANAWRARLEQTRGNVPKARQLGEASVAGWALSSDNWTLLGGILVRAGEWNKAEEAFQKALALRPAHPGALDGMFQVCDQRRDYASAISYLEKGVMHGSVDHPRANLFLEYLETRGVPDEAINIRAILTAMRPWDKENRRALIRLYLATGKFPNAKAELESLQRDAPEDAENRWAQAEYWRVTKEPERGRQLLLAFLAQRGDQATAEDWLGYAEYLRQTGFEKEFVATVRNAVSRQDAKTMPATWVLADWFMRHGEYESAVAAFRRLREGTGDRRASYGLVESLLALRQFADAERELRAIRAPDPVGARHSYLEARVAAGLGRVAEAVGACNRCLDQSPKDLPCLLLRAQLRFQESDEAGHKAVLDDLQRAVQLDAREPLARELLVRWFLREKQLRNALNHAQALANLQPDKPAAQILLANVCVELQDTDLLDGYLRDWQKRFPDLPDWHEFKARVSLARKKDAEALPELAAAYRYRPGPEVLLPYAACLIRTGNAAQAATLLTGDASATVAGSPRLQAMAGRAFTALDRIPEGETFFRTAVAGAGARLPEVEAVVGVVTDSVSKPELPALLGRLSSVDTTGLCVLYQASFLAMANQAGAALPLLEKLGPRLAADSPLLGRYYLCLGNARHLLKQYKEAKAAFDEALKHLPQDAVALNNLAAELSEHLGQAQAALPLAEKAVQLADGNPDIQAYCLDTLGYAQLQAELLFEAESTLRRSLRVKELPVCRMHLASLYLARQQPGKARAELNTALVLAEKAGETVLAETIRTQLANLPGPAAENRTSHE